MMLASRHDSYVANQFRSDVFVRALRNLVPSVLAMAASVAFANRALDFRRAIRSNNLAAFANA